jgi:hypothetical protein
VRIDHLGVDGSRQRFGGPTGHDSIEQLGVADEVGCVFSARGASQHRDHLLPAPFAGPIDLVNLVAQSELTQSCFAENWMHYSYARAVEPADACSVEQVEQAFAASGSNIKALLVALTQSDAFLYLSPEQP